MALGSWWHRWTGAQARTAPGGSPPTVPVPVPVAPPRIRRTALSGISVLTASARAANALRGVVDGLRTREVLAHGAYGAVADFALAVFLAGALLSRRRG
jgi:hypothetical protein